MMTVTELAKKSGATPDAVRYYTRMGLLKPERNPANGYRLYEPKEINWLKFIRQAKTLGFTLHEIQQIMQNRSKGHSPCPHVRETLKNRIVENRQHLKELLALQDRMEKALLQWVDIADGDDNNGDVCPLIAAAVSSKSTTTQL
jgi:DNA-binding transcriptional MerR regulator